MRIDALFSVIKPLHWTSSQVVVFLRALLSPSTGGRRARLKVGHGGTLDPGAQGVLVIGVGKGTKALGSFMEGAEQPVGSKGYEGVMRVGQETDSLDADGTVVATDPIWSPLNMVSEGEVGAYRSGVLDRMCESAHLLEGFQMQRAPMFSSKKVGGKPMHRIARELMAKLDGGEPTQGLDVHRLQALLAEGTEDGPSFSEKEKEAILALVEGREKRVYVDAFEVFPSSHPFHARGAPQEMRSDQHLHFR